MNYKHFTIEEREIIQTMLWQHTSIRSIATALGRSPSSVSREVKRNKPPVRNHYTPRLADKRAHEKRTHRGRKLRLKNGVVRRYVVNKLKEGWSPEQIAGRLSLDHPEEHISHEAIYQYIYSHVYREGYGYMKPHYHDLRPYLKRRHTRRVPHGGRACRKAVRQRGISIEERPKAVNNRSHIGHWENDTVESCRHKAGINTLVERKSGLVFMTKLTNKKSSATTEAIVRRLGVLPQNKRLSITFDNGSENAGWKTVQETLGSICYFAHPYCSGERGTNENTNGLIRWYFPKGTDFTTVSEEALSMVEYMLNTRPRKRLGWRTPLEDFNASVALQC